MKTTKRTPPTNRKKNIPEETVVITIPNHKGTPIYLIIVFIIPLLIYLQTLGFGFTYFDDDGLILNNLGFLSDFRNAPQAFVTDAFITKISPFYRPLQSLSYMTDIQLSGGNHAWMFHLTNLMLLGFTSCAIFTIMIRFALHTAFALLATLIYCAHPLFVTSVSWIPARGDLMLMLFSLLSFLFFIDYLQKQKLIFLLLHWAAFTLALFCKETAAFLPILFFLFFITKSGFKIPDKKYFIPFILYTVSGIFWYWMRAQSIGDFTNRTDVFGPNAILPNLRTIPESLFMFFIPIEIAVIPGYTMIKSIGGLLILLLLLVLVFKNQHKASKDKLFFLAWFLLLIIPTLLFKHVLIDYLTHRFFLPLTGIFILVLLCLPKEWTQQKNKTVMGVMIAILLIFSTISFVDSKAYSNRSTFYDAAIAKNPNSAIAFNNRGHDKIKNNNFQSAIDDLNKAIEIYDRYEMAYNNRGYAKSKIGDMNGAMEDFNSSININNNFAEPYFNRANTNLSMNNYTNAIADFDRYLILRPEVSEAYNFRGMALGSSGNFKEAILSFNKAIEINPNFLEAYGNRSIAKYSVNDFTGAMEDCNKVLALSPGNQNATDLLNRIKLNSADTLK